MLGEWEERRAKRTLVQKRKVELPLEGRGQWAHGRVLLASGLHMKGHVTRHLRCCRTYLGRVVLEHGAGIGTFSSFLVEEAVEKLVVVEPAANLLPALRERLAPWGDKVELVSSTLEESAELLRGRSIDTVISVNVLEHIPDDLRTLRTMWEILPEEGRVILFVPAPPWLYGSLDRAFEHVRRYQRQELHDKAATASES